MGAEGELRQPVNIKKPPKVPALRDNETLHLLTCAAKCGGPNVVARERPRPLPGLLPPSPLPAQWTGSAMRQFRATLRIRWAPPHLYGGEVHAAHTGPQRLPSAYL